MHTRAMNHQNSATSFDQDDWSHGVTTRSLTAEEAKELLDWLDEPRDPSDRLSYRSRSFTYNSSTSQFTLRVRSESDRIELVLRWG